jgi:mitotic spindle assembly checkpoint protein MAD2
VRAHSNFAICSRLTLGIYLPETFKRESKYGVTVLTTTDEGLMKYLSNVQQQVSSWLQTGQIQRLVVVVKGVDTLETLERWQFNVSIDKSEIKSCGIGADENMAPNQTQQPLNDTNGKHCDVTTGKSLKEIHNEIQAIIRQITASVTFLPLLQQPCTFDLLVYTNKDVDNVPATWSDSDPCYILNNSSEVKLRSFTTSIHKVDTLVAYKETDDWDLN